MKKSNLTRNAHFLGTKIRNLRKRNNLTMEDLSGRCVRVNAESAPSVSYLSMIERGKRYPSDDMLQVIATVFQKEIDWFLDDTPDMDAAMPAKGRKGGIRGIALEPSFLFSSDILQIAIPEMLSQAGVSGRQFAQLLIRAHQEINQNHFPDLERAAESIGKKQMPLSVEEMLSLTEAAGLRLNWFDKLKPTQLKELGVHEESFVRSYFTAPDTVHLNRVLEKQPARLKYDLAVYIGHKMLHNGDGVKSPMVANRQLGNRRELVMEINEERIIDAQDMVHAWRDFECSFFAGALLCPKVPFRRLIEQHAYDVTVGRLIDVTSSVVMRRMTAVSSYPHWHYFDAYPPGKLNAVYRGNGIPLPWGNMRLVQDPCQHWAVFRKLGSTDQSSSAQISLLDADGETRIYCCESLKVTDVVGIEQVLCAGIDINPAIDATGTNANELAQELKLLCIRNGGMALIPKHLQPNFQSVAKILNIAWLERGIESEVRLICQRSGACPRSPKCHT